MYINNWIYIIIYIIKKLILNKKYNKDILKIEPFFFFETESTISKTHYNINIYSCIFPMRIGLNNFKVKKF
jgi:hypothetical protein